MEKMPSVNDIDWSAIMAQHVRNSAFIASPPFSIAHSCVVDDSWRAL